MKNATFFATALLMFSGPAFSEVKDLGDVSQSAIKGTEVAVPARPAPVSPVIPPGVTIANYSTDEVFSFESQAKPAMDARITVLKAAGITTLGGRVVPAGNDYSFVIDYIPTVKSGASLPPAVTIETYNNGETYWRSADAQAAMNACAANFRSAQVPALSSYLYDAGNDSAFAVDYVNKNLLRPTPEYDVVFNTYQGGKFTFESEAVKNIGAYSALFKSAGIPAIRGKAVQRPDGNYSVQIEYVVRSNKYGARPQFSIARYDSQEIFTFDTEALKASQERLAVFTRAGVPPVSNIVRPSDSNYSFSVDYLVYNIYQQGNVIPSAAIETYQASETFTFDTEAKKAMQDKAAAFEAAGMPVVGSRVTGSLGSFTYAIEYITKAQQPAPPPPGPQNY